MLKPPHHLSDDQGTHPFDSKAPATRWVCIVKLGQLNSGFETALVIYQASFHTHTNTHIHTPYFTKPTAQESHGTRNMNHAG